MSLYPNALDQDSNLPRVDNNITSIGGDAINALRSAVFAIEGALGVNPQGATASLASRLAVSLDQNGNILPSALTGLGLVTLPITNIQISPVAGIAESKLALTYSTSTLYNLFTALNDSVEVFNGFLSTIGIRIVPHFEGTGDRHLLSHIDVNPGTSFLKTNPISGATSPGSSVISRNTTNLETLELDLSNDLVIHEKSDGSPGITGLTGGTVPPTDYAHVADGIWLDSTGFITIPQTSNDVQKLADFIDSSSLLLLGSRTQNLFENGVARSARAISLVNGDGYGANIIPPTPVQAFLLNRPPGPISSSPQDSITNGDDIIQFLPTSMQLSTHTFDAQFAQVQPGDVVTINYGTGISYQFVIDSIGPSPSVYTVRINGRNPTFTTDGYAQVDRTLFNRNKYNVLAAARAPNSLSGVYESLINGSPRGAMALGNNFDAFTFDNNHYNLYLSLLPNGDTSSILTMPAIDVTGNQGTTPGQYTLDSIVDNINTAFRAPGFNFRFIAFQYQGQLGIALADHYRNCGFSIIAGVPNSSGAYDASSNASFPNNVIDNFNLIDPTGFGALGSNLASSPPAVSYFNFQIASLTPTVVFLPLKRNFYYVAGVERDSFFSDPINLDGTIDAFGDGYWPATILSATNLSGRVSVVYQVNLDLSTTGLKAGKTLVIQPSFPTSDSRYNPRDYGRFLISNVSYNNCGTSSAYTNITVYDAVHGFGSSPSTISPDGTLVSLYFSDDSVSFDAENVGDTGSPGTYKRYFENYIDKNGHTFGHERARFSSIASGSYPTAGTLINLINMISVSPKLRGYITNNDVAIRLTISTYDQTTGLYSGNLGRWNIGSSTLTNSGPITLGKKGEVVRFYDETNIDYIDFIFNLTDSIASFSSQTLDIQLYKSLQLNQEFFYISSCQVNDGTSPFISKLEDTRQFGNISEEQLSNSAFDYIASASKAISNNGIINGFDGYSASGDIFSLNGGAALIQGKVVLTNENEVVFPILLETLAPGFTTTVATISWFLCANKNGDIELIASTDYPTSLSGTYGALTQDRIFYVENPNAVTPSAYAIRGTYLSNLLINFTDVVPLYSVTTTTTLSGSVYTTVISAVSDIRRFL